MKTADPARPAYVLDTSALLAYLTDEPGGHRLRAIRDAAALPFVALTELFYVLWRHRDQGLAEETVQTVLSWHLPLLVPDERLSLSAGYFKARHRLGLADSYIAAFAFAHHATLVTKDPDFRTLASDIKMLYLE